ncbi:MAG: hypothetical protein K9L69_00570 [Candidatus Omnitrophica bacterium]|nr:hypothetical protein [Candidatus Omnitrophota bacterium]MCF7894621.1 hypothetical protein [Candidatus Omnitrophota bacterium]
MKSKKQIITIIAIIVLLGIGLYGVNKGSTIEVLGAKAGIVVGYRGDIPKIEETKTINLNEGVKFGWIIITKDADRNIFWQEIIIFPEKPKNLVVSEDTKISSNGKEAITKRSSNLKDGIIYNVWGLDKSDPIGEYEIKVYGEGKLLKQFSFTVK